MYLRISTRKRNGKTYKSLRLVESYRVKTEEGIKIRQRILANFGNLDRFTEKDIDNIFSGLCRIFGRPLPENTSSAPTADEALEYGQIHALLHLWKELKWAQEIQRASRGSRVTFDLEQHIKTLVLNRLCDPCSKLALLDWLEQVYIPGVNREGMRYEHLLRAMDWLIEHKEELERRFTERALGLFKQDLRVVFYDCTSVYFQGHEGDEDFRKFGYSRDKRKDRPQVVVGLVMTKDGLPVAHYTFPGNTADKSTFRGVIQDLRQRWGVERCVVVADRGMLTEVNLSELEAGGFGYVLSLNMKQHKAFLRALPRLKKGLEAEWEERYGKEEEAERSRDVYREQALEGLRLVVAYNPARAEHSRRLRERLCEAAEEAIFGWIEKLNAQDRGMLFRGRGLTDQGVLLKTHDLLKRKGIRSYYRVFLDEKGYVRCHKNRKVWNRAERLDGILAVITTEKELTPKEVIEQYKDLQDVERGFRTLKSSLEIRPVYHWTERRIRAHVFLCVMALQMQRAMRTRLRRNGSRFSPEAALRKLSTVHALRAGKHWGMTTLKEAHRTIYRQLEIPFPKVETLA